ncbi:hypothetical protein ACGFRG_01415 [Streptomyces sp. NPDC048696]
MIADLQRTACGAQFGDDIPLFVDCGVPLWAPGAGGAIDLHNEAHTT